MMSSCPAFLCLYIEKKFTEFTLPLYESLQKLKDVYGLSNTSVFVFLPKKIPITLQRQ